MKTIIPLKTRYAQEIAPVLMKELGLTNTFAVPSIKKVVINIGIPKTDSSEKDVAVAATELGSISGQKVRITAAKRAIAGFKIRAGDAVGVAVTLRGERMFDFLDKLCRIVLPQDKDFRGVKATAFDGNGNYTLGLTEQVIFPEIDYAKVDKVRGMEIVIVTSATDNKVAYRLLELIGMPFEKKVEEK